MNTAGVGGWGGGMMVQTSIPRSGIAAIGDYLGLTGQPAYSVIFRQMRDPVSQSKIASS